MSGDIAKIRIWKFTFKKDRSCTVTIFDNTCRFSC